MKKNKGITLIMLVITIIIILVLAGVAINLVIGKNGLINKSKTSKMQYEDSAAKEVIDNVKAEYSAECTSGNTDVTLSGFVKYIQDNASDKLHIINTSNEDNSNLEGLTYIKISVISYPAFTYKIGTQLEILDTTYNGKVDNDNGEEVVEESGVTYVQVTITNKTSTSFVMNTNLNDVKIVKNIKYYVDNEVVYSGTDKSFKVTGLPKGSEHQVYATVEFDNRTNSTIGVQLNTASIPEEGLTNYWPLQNSLNNEVNSTLPFITSDGNNAVFENGSCKVTSTQYLKTSKNLAYDKANSTIIFEGSFDDAKSYLGPIMCWTTNPGDSYQLTGIGGYNSFDIWNASNYNNFYEGNEYNERGVWHTYVLTADSSGVYFYIDGTKVYTTTANERYVDSPLFLCHSGYSGSIAMHFRNVAVYNRALTADEVASISF